MGNVAYRELMEHARKWASISVPHLLERLYVTTTTRCNFGCVFCGRTKSRLTSMTMSTDRFALYIDKATAFGFRVFNLTPVIGEALTDATFADKLRLLEANPSVEAYYFCTNLAMANRSFLVWLDRQTKLKSFSVSVYGHDFASFARLTRGDRRSYERVVANLGFLADCPELLRRGEIRLRTTYGFRLDRCVTDVCLAIQRLAAAGMRVRIPERFQNWGGLVDPRELTDKRLVAKPLRRKESPCVFIFYKPTLLPDGRINACGEGDAEANHVIGDLNRQAFDEVFSLSNPKLVNMLSSHCTGNLRGPCRGCTGYRGVGEPWYSYAFHVRPAITLAEYFECLAGSRAWH
jgi:hypothetical protein